MNPRFWLALGALLAALGVASGAFGAHALESWLEAKGQLDRLDTWEVAVRYQLYHAFGMLTIGLLGMHRSCRWLTLAGWLFLVGVVLFSGLLYALVLTGQTKLGMVVPLGGLAFIVGWLALAIGVLGLRPDSDSN